MLLQVCMKYFEECGYQQFLVPIDLHTVHVKGYQHLVTHILQNIFCIQQINEIHTGLEQLKGE